MIHLDTHVVVWLYAGQVERFPGAALERLESEVLVVSPMVVLELQYLFEIGRVTQPAATVIEDLRERIGLEVAAAPFSAVVSTAATLSWTRDPFDRLIAAQAMCEGAELMTADETIRRHMKASLWDD